MRRGRRFTCARHWAKSSRPPNRHWSCFEIAADTAAANGAGLRITIADAACATEAVARRTSHDSDGDCGYAALDRSRVGHRNFLWLHAAVSAQDVVVDCCGVWLPL